MARWNSFVIYDLLMYLNLFIFFKISLQKELETLKMQLIQVETERNDLMVQKDRLEAKVSFKFFKQFESIVSVTKKINLVRAKQIK